MAKKGGKNIAAPVLPATIGLTNGASAMQAYWEGYRQAIEDFNSHTQAKGRVYALITLRECAETALGLVAAPIEAPAEPLTGDDPNVSL